MTCKDLRINQRLYHIWRGIKQRCHCAKEDNLCMALCDDIKHNICAYRFKNDGSDIGEKVFRTKSEAEAKLKELNEK